MLLNPKTCGASKKYDLAYTIFYLITYYISIYYDMASGNLVLM